MAETYLYSVSEQNEQLKKDVKAAGGSVKFDRERGAYALQTEGLDKGQIKAIKDQLPQYVGDAARKAWAADRQQRLANGPTEVLRGEARKRESTTTEPKPERRVVQDQGITMYPAISQKDDFRKLVEETQSQSTYHKARGDVGAHYKVITTSPDKFAEFVGPDAEARFKREFAERAAAGEAPERPQNTNTPTEVAREAARKLNGKAFMAQYQERGFRLADAEASPANHQKQLNTLREASPAQIVDVKRTSEALLGALRDKETALRAEAAGLPVEQVKAMSFQQQKEVGVKDGKPVGLVGDEFKMAMQLDRGIKAMEVELQDRGYGKKPERSQEQGQSQSQGQGQRQAAEKPQGKAMSEEQSVGNDLEVMSAFANNRRGRGR